MGCEFRKICILYGSEEAYADSGIVAVHSGAVIACDNALDFGLGFCPMHDQLKAMDTAPQGFLDAQLDESIRTVIEIRRSNKEYLKELELRLSKLNS